MKRKREERRVVINVSGEIFETYETTLKRYPHTLLGNRRKLYNYYCHRSNCIRFNRSRLIFNAILFFYQSDGKLFRPPLVELEDFVKECRFFQIPKRDVDKMLQEEGIMLYKKEKKFQSGASQVQKKIWECMNNPSSSLLASVYSVLSMSVIGVSVTCACVETLPSLREHSNILSQNPFGLVEIVVNVIFTIDLVFRLLSSPGKVAFALSFLNWVDVLGIASYFVFLSIIPHSEETHNLVRFLRIIKVVCLFRLSKHSKRIRVALQCLRSLYADFQVVCMCFVIAFMFGGSMLYYAEHASKSTAFTSIPESFWWAVQTITSLGYGDVIPMTVFGRLLATIFMLCSVVSAALPVIWLMTKFEIIYSLNVHLNNEFETDNRYPNPRRNRLTILQNDQIKQA